MNRKYIDLHTIYSDKELESENYQIIPFSLDADLVTIEKVRASLDGKKWFTNGLKADFPYVKLIYKPENEVMMSDTPMERNTNQHFLNSAHGDVLIFGLGLGLIVLPLLEAENVSSVTVIELHQDLIDMVQPILKKHDKSNKLKCIQGDCFTYHEQIKGRMYDCIYGDIWMSISTDNYEDMKFLTRKYHGKLKRNNPNKFVDHWMKEYLKQEIQIERRESLDYIFSGNLM